jgi:hypothetical protein
VSTTFRTITSEDWRNGLRLSRKRREQQQRIIRAAIERRLREIGSVTFSRPAKAASNDDNQ